MAHIYLLPKGDQGLSGLCVLVQDQAEAAFINIVGNVSLDSLTEGQKVRFELSPDPQGRTMATDIDISG